jgi:hypothetical protein
LQVDALGAKEKTMILPTHPPFTKEAQPSVKCTKQGCKPTITIGTSFTEN